MNQKDYRKLCEAVERETGRTLTAASDFKWLSEQILERTHELLSDSTLMRLWGYRQGVEPRKATLDIVARYLGFSDFAAFCRENTDNESEPNSENEAEPIAQNEVEPIAQNEESAKKTYLLYVIIGLLLLMIGGGIYSLLRPTQKNHDSYVLRKGERFPTYESYLKLFGITETHNRPWSQPLPHHHNIIVFGGEYLHPNWGNEGDTADLLPLRFERWRSDYFSAEMEAVFNRERYDIEKESKRLIITFMKNLVDTGFVFCGVYRMSLEQSDTTRLVWERVADELDLLNIEYLEQLRH